MKRWLLLPLVLVCRLAAADISFIAGATNSPSGTTDATVSVPTGTQLNDVMFGFYSNGDDATSSVALTGWTPIGTCIASTLGSDTFVCAWYKVASGSEPASYVMDATGSASNVTTGTIVTFRGVDTSNPLDVAFVEANHSARFQNDATPLPKPITTANNGAWVLLWSLSANSTSVTDVVPPTNYTERSQTLANNRYAATSSRAIATAATETPGDITLTGAAATEETAILTLAIRAAAAAAPAFDSGPTLDGVTATGATFDYDANADVDNVQCMATDTVDGATPPTAAEIEAQTGSHGYVTEAATGSADTITVGFSDSPVYPIYDVHCVTEEGTSNYGTVVTVSDVTPDAPTDMQFDAITSAAALSPCALFNAATNPDIANGDYLRSATTTTPGDYALSIAADCQFEYEGGEDDSQQSVLDILVFDASAAAYHADDIDYFNNNNAPVCPTETVVFVFDEDELIDEFDLNALCVDEDGDTLTFEDTSGTFPNGIELSGDNDELLGGTPDTEDETGAAMTFTVTDPAGETDTFTATLYVIDTVELADYTAGTLAEAQAQHLLDFPWQAENLQLALSFECSAEDEDEVISQDPLAASEVSAYESVAVDVSNGVACGSIDLTGLPLSWSSWANVLADPDFIAIKRGECDGDGVWAAWLAGTSVTPRGSANCVVDVDLIEQEADGSAEWARWAPGTTSKNSGNLQIDVRAALTADFVPN